MKDDDPIVENRNRLSFFLLLVVPPVALLANDVEVPRQTSQASFVFFSSFEVLLDGLEGRNTLTFGESGGDLEAWDERDGRLGREL